MKNNFKLLVVALGAILLSLPAVRAQENNPPGERRKAAGERVGAAMGFSDEQKAQMKELAQQEKAELGALRDDTSLSKEDRRAKLEAIRQSYQAKRQALMTSEQRAKADTVRERLEKRRENRQGGERPEGTVRPQRPGKK